MRCAQRFALVALLLPAGCLEMAQESTLFPDGSGKIRIRVTIKGVTLEKFEGGLRAGNPDPSLQVALLVAGKDPLHVEKAAEGVVAWRIEKETEDAEGIHFEWVAYFEDLNKVRLVRGGNPVFSARYERNGDGGRLAVTDELRSSLKEAEIPEAAPDEGARKFIEGFMPAYRDFKASYSVTVPGPIVDASGWTETKDRTAGLSLDFQTFLDLLTRPGSEQAKKLKAAGEHKEGMVVWKETRVTAAEVDAFRKELADAKAAWTATLEDARRKTPK